VIYLNDVSKYSSDPALGTNAIFEHISADLPIDRLTALLGDSAGVLSALLHFAAGSEMPDGGIVTRSRAHFSPVINSRGVAGASLSRKLNGYDNLNFFGRIHGVDVQALATTVLKMAGLGILMDLPMNSWHPSARQGFEVALLAALPYDCYLVDRMHDLPPRQRRQILQKNEMSRVGVIFTTTLPGFASKLADFVAVVSQKSIDLFEKVEKGSAG
jgi:ABC-type polysaccharide/polyol phosphate transport system ATPase subunit